MEEAHSPKALEVIHPGALTTVQDLGRYGYQKYGVPISGAVDKYSLRVANLLVGNREGEAALEITVLGPKLKALRPLMVALAGGDLSPRIDGQPCLMWRSHLVKEGEIISFGAVRSGCRAYLGVSGGISVPSVLGSSSTHVQLGLGGFGRALKQGDIIRIGGGKKGQEEVPREVPGKHIPLYTGEWLIRVIPGPQLEYFTPRGLKTLMEGEYGVTPESDRMASRLKGHRIEHRGGADVITDATPPGSIQVPGDGMPIIFLADGQATGGYAKIAVAITPDQDKLGQAKPGDRIRFQKVDLEKAHLLRAEMQERIRAIKSSFDL